jgi:hypothetical protein
MNTPSERVARHTYGSVPLLPHPDRTTYLISRLSRLRLLMQLDGSRRKLDRGVVVQE